MGTEDLKGLVPNTVALMRCFCYFLVVYLDGHICWLPISKYTLQNKILSCTFSFLLTRTKIKDCDQNRLLQYSKLSISTYTEGEWRWCIRCGMEDGSFKCPMKKPVYFSLHSSNLQILNQNKNKKL